MARSLGPAEAILDGGVYEPRPSLTAGGRAGSRGEASSLLFGCGERLQLLDPESLAAAQQACRLGQELRTDCSWCYGAPCWASAPRADVRSRGTILVGMAHGEGNRHRPCRPGEGAAAAAVLAWPPKKRQGCSGCASPTVPPNSAPGWKKILGTATSATPLPASGSSTT